LLDTGPDLVQIFTMLLVGGRPVSTQLLGELKQMADSCSRRQLARHLCQQMDWRAPNGARPLMAARLALKALAQQGHLLLPPAVASPRRRPPSEIALSARSSPAVECSLAELGVLEIVLVGKGGSASSRQWNQLMRHHYLGPGPLCGAQLRYLVLSVRGPVAGLAFSAAARRLRGRDQWIGWSEAARRENLHLVVNNSRFLILPHVKVANLASHLLSWVLTRLPDDWQVRYGYRPVLVETFVERQRFAGTSYRAANWQVIALSSGRGRQDRTHQAGQGPKLYLVRPLREDFRASLQRLPERPRLAWLPTPAKPPAPSPPVDWAQEEFGQAPLEEARLVRRLCLLARDLYAQPQAALPQACGNRVKTKAAYRFFDHVRVNLPSVLKSHYQSSAARAAREPVALAVQDTTSLNYSAHPATELLGPISRQPDGAMGMLVHSTLAFNLAGTPLGLLDVQCWVREPEEFGKKHQRYELPLEAKESVRWLRSLQALEQIQASCPQTRLISVGDREADIYELFVWAKEKPGRPGLLVRAERQRLLTQQQGPLWAHVESQPVAGQLEVKVPRRGQRAARVAVLEVRFAAVELRPPKRKPDLPTVQLWAVLAREVGAPAGTEPLDWMLLSTEPVNDCEAAVEKLRWYTRRWGIEVFHRVLKSGCKIESRRLGNADRLEACLGIDLVVAWRIYHLTKLGRETPAVPCTVYFEEHEWQALVAFVTRQPEPPKEPPTLREALRMVAGLGGFLGRKGDGEPGTETLWRGLQRLDDIGEAYLVFRSSPKEPPVSSDRRYG
jgi:hypothetical protein